MTRRIPLLAKSSINSDGASLASHTAWVLAACNQVLASVRNSIHPMIDYEALCLISRLGAVFHDLGKATDLFQGMLYGDIKYRAFKHPVTHEVLSALLITVACPKLADWLSESLSGRPKHWIWMIAWVTGGHHLRMANQEYGNPLIRTDGVPEKITFYGNEVKPLLRMAANITGASDIPELSDLEIVCGSGDCEGTWHGSLVRSFVRKSQQYEITEKEQLLIAYAKAILIAADVAGSALPTGQRQ